jgi:hypothetical protein
MKPVARGKNICITFNNTLYYIISDRNASFYKSENFDRRVHLRTSGTLLTSFMMAFRSRVIYIRRFILQVQLL